MHKVSTANGVNALGLRRAGGAPGLHRGGEAPAPQAGVGRRSEAPVPQAGRVGQGGVGKPAAQIAAFPWLRLVALCGPSPRRRGSAAWPTCRGSGPAGGQALALNPDLNRA